MRLTVFLPCYNQATQDVKRAQEVQEGRKWTFEELGKKSTWRGEVMVSVKFILGSPIIVQNAALRNPNISFSGHNTHHHQV